MKKVINTIVFSLIMVIISTCSYAEDITAGITQPTIDPGLAGSINGIIGLIQIVGTLVAVGACVYLGIRYVISSVEEKADIKKKLIPFVIGTIIFFGATGILQLIAYFAGLF